jgi:hypothetical protein
MNELRQQNEDKIAICKPNIREKLNKQKKPKKTGAALSGHKNRAE